MNESIDLVLDGGGSGTRAALVTQDSVLVTRTGASCSPAAVRERALPNLLSLLTELLQTCEAAHRSGVTRGVFAVSAAPTQPALDRFVEEVLLRASTHPLYPRDVIWVLNDIVPLTAPHAPCAAVICGTGTGFAAVSEQGGWTRASGLEYLLSDEGGGFEIGLQGLRAVVRSLDGRGPSTSLARRLPNQMQDAEAVFDWVYEAAEQKTAVASFAPVVLEAAAAGDPASARIVENAADELCAGVAAVSRGSGLTQPFVVRYSGSLLLSDHSYFRDEFIRRLADQLQTEPRAANPNPLNEVIGFHRELDRIGDALERAPLTRRLPPLKAGR